MSSSQDHLTRSCGSDPTGVDLDLWDPSILYQCGGTGGRTRSGGGVGGKCDNKFTTTTCFLLTGRGGL